MQDEKITLFLADDHQIVIEGIIALAARDPSIQVVGQCSDGLLVLGQVEAIRPDVVVLDISLPGLNGLDLCHMIKERLPETAVLMLTMHANESCIVDALESGATGYLIKESVSGEFCEAVHAVARGEVYLGRGIPRSVLKKVSQHEPDPHDTLTDVERQVIQLSVEGKSNRQIGELLDMAASAVDAEYFSAMKKLGLTNQTELIKYAVRRRMITID